MTSDKIKSIAKDAADQTGQAADMASDSIKAAAHDTQIKSTRLADQAKDLAGQASDAANDLYGRASEKVSQAAASLPDPSEAMAKSQRAFETGTSQVVSKVKKQPLEALLLAAAIGYLVGWATSRG